MSADWESPWRLKQPIKTKAPTTPTSPASLSRKECRNHLNKIHSLLRTSTHSARKQTLTPCQSANFQSQAPSNRDQRPALGVPQLDPHELPVAAPGALGITGRFSVEPCVYHRSRAGEEKSCKLKTIKKKTRGDHSILREQKMVDWSHRPCACMILLCQTQKNAILPTMRGLCHNGGLCWCRVEMKNSMLSY